jgi:hypothetical protein
MIRRKQDEEAVEMHLVKEKYLITSYYVNLEEKVKREEVERYQ